MEYETDNELNYTTLQIRSKLILKRNEKKATKRTPTQIPLGGMGNGLERAYSKNSFIPSSYNIRKMIWFFLVLIQDETKSLQSAKIKDFSKKGRPLGGFGWPESHFLTAASLVFVIPAKKKWVY